MLGGRRTENSFNNFMVNLSAPIGWKQCLSRFDSGGAAGGNATTTDGTVVWSQSNNGGNALYRADERPWGSCNTAYRALTQAGEQLPARLRLTPWNSPKASWGERRERRVLP